MYIGPTNVEDWLEYQTDGRIYIESDARALLAPKNRFRNPGFQIMGKDGSPMHYTLVIGQQQIGTHVNLSAPPAGPASQTRQTIEMLPLGTTSWEAVALITDGAKRPPQDDRLPRAVMGTVRNEHTGYAAGTYRAAYAWATINRVQTNISERASFTLDANYGGLEWSFDDEPPEGARYRVLYLTTPGGSDLWQQALIPANAKTWKMWGPVYRNRKAPTSNETRLGQARQPRWGDDRELRIGNGNYWLAAAQYRFRFIEGNARGSGLASPRSDVREVGNRRNTAIKCRLRHKHPETTKFKVIAEINGINYLVNKSFRQDEGWFDENALIEVYGHLEQHVERVDDLKDRLQEEREQLNEMIKLRRDDNPNNDPTDGEMRQQRELVNELEAKLGVATNVAKDDGFWTLEETELPTEDTSGVEGPDDAPESPLPIGAPLPANGTYYGSYSPVYGEEHLGGVPASSPPDSIFVGVGFAPQINIPNLANALRNAEHTKVGRNGVPLNMTSQDNHVPTVENGRLVINTGLRTDAGNSPRYYYDSVLIERDDVWTVRGSILGKNVISGAGRVHLEFLNGSTVLTSDTVLCGTIETGAQVDWALRVGPSNATPAVDKVYPATATHMRYRIDFLNTTFSGSQQRNLTMEVFDMAFHPLDGAPRKFGMPALGSGDFADPNPSNETPFRSGNVCVVAEPPAKSPITDFTPVQKLNFDGGSVDSTWTQQTGGGATLAVETGAAIFGSHGMRIQQASTSQVGVANINRQFPTNLLDGSRVALRIQERVVQLPTGGDNTYGLEASSISAVSGKGGVWWYWNKYGQLRRGVTDRYGNWYHKVVLYNVVNGNLVDYEVIIDKANTDNAVIYFLVGVNGQQRRIVDSMSGVRMSGMSLRNILAGIGDGRYANQTWQFHLDDVSVTEQGDELLNLNAAPINVPMALPDRPGRTAAIYQTNAGALNYTHTEARDRMGVMGEWDMPGNPPSESTLADIKDEAGVVLADIRLKTDNRMSVRTRTASGTFREHILRTALNYPARHGAEIIVSGVGSAGGSVTGYYISPAGVRTAHVYSVGTNWEGKKAKSAQVYSDTPYVAADASASAEGSEVIADRDTNGELTKQLYIFKHPLIPQKELGLKGMVGTLIPGQFHTIAWKMRWRFAGTEPSFPLRYYLRNRQGNTIPLGSIVEAGCTDQSTWQDRWRVIDPANVPPGFTELWLDTGVFEQGEFVAQDPLFALGNLTTQEARDAQRELVREDEGEIIVTVPFGLPVKAPYVSRALGHNKLRELFADVQYVTDDDGTPFGSATVDYSTSPQDPPVSWSNWFEFPDDCPPGAVGRIRVHMFGDGNESPVLETGHIGYRFTHRLSTLLRADGSPLPGGTFVNGLENAITTPDFNSEPVLGHARNDPITDPITRLERPVTIFFLTEEAYVEFAEEAQLRDWMYEAINLGPAGRFYVFRPYAKPTLNGQQLNTQVRDANLRRYVFGSITVESAEVVEQGDIGEDLSI